MTHKPSRSMIYERDDHTCQYCGATKHLTIDHVIPRSRGGQDTWKTWLLHVLHVIPKKETHCWNKLA